MKKTVIGFLLLFCVWQCSAATVTTEVLLHFDGTRSGSTYTLDAGEIDTTGTLVAYGSPTINSGVVTNDAFNEGFEIVANPTIDVDTSFVIEIIADIDWVTAATSSFEGTFADALGNFEIRYQRSTGGLRLTHWSNTTGSRNIDVALPAAGMHHYAGVWTADGSGSTGSASLYVDGVLMGTTSGGAMRQDANSAGWGAYSRFNGRGAYGTYTAASLSTFTGTFDSGTDFLLLDSSRLVIDAGAGVEVQEKDYSDTYTVMLSVQPTDDVTVQIIDDSDPDQVTTDVSVLTFTTANWDTPQTVTVTAVEDPQEADIHTTVLQHRVTSTDPDYSSEDDTDLTVTVYDDRCSLWGFWDGDVNLDCDVDIEDLVDLAAVWSTIGTDCAQSGYLDADINTDCRVDFVDFSEVAFDWNQCSEPFEEGCTNLLSDASALAKPSSTQVVWHDHEVGMFIHYSINTYLDQEWDTAGDPANLVLFNPTDLDTDEWVAAAEAMGAGYIMFVAKHVGGFCIWQTDTSDYSIKNTPYQGGNGDVLADLVASCKARNMPLGLYISPQDRFYGTGVGGRAFDPADQATYDAVYRAQLTEVLQNYGPFMEVWFDGNIIVPVTDILNQYATNADVLQSPGGTATLRWVGNERGECPYPGWNGVSQAVKDSGVGTVRDGDPDGDAWLPLECDARSRADWFWNTHNAGTLKTLDKLMSMYYSSVGHGAVLLLNMTPDPTGAMPAADVARITEFGQEVLRRFDQPIAETYGEGYFVTLDLPEPNTINHVVTMEDITGGERIREYVIEGFVGGSWQQLASGTAIGHKKIDTFTAVDNVEKVRVRTTQAAADPIIRKLAVYNTDVSVYVPPTNPFEVIEQWIPGDPATGPSWYVWDIDATTFISHAETYELVFEKTSGANDIEIQSVVFVLDGVERADLVTELAGDNQFRITVPCIATEMLLRTTVRGDGGSSSYGDVKLRRE